MIYCILFPIQEQQHKDTIIITSQQKPPSFFIPSLTDNMYHTCFIHWNVSFIILVALIIYYNFPPLKDLNKTKKQVVALLHQQFFTGKLKNTLHNL